MSKRHQISAAADAAVLTVDEAASFLHVSRTTMYSLFKTQAVPRARLGGRTLVRRSDLDALLARAITFTPAGSSPAREREGRAVAPALSDVFA